MLIPVPYNWDPVCPWYEWAEENCKRVPGDNDLKVSCIFDLFFVSEAIRRDDVNSFIEYISNRITEIDSESGQGSVQGSVQGSGEAGDEVGARVGATAEAMDV
jgi:hypothetical protein